MSRGVLLRVASPEAKQWHDSVRSCWEGTQSLGIWSRHDRVGRSRWEERMEVGTLMAAVRRTYWVANARAFQGERAKGSETRVIVFCLLLLPRGSRSANGVEILRRSPGEREGGSDAKLLPGCELPRCLAWDAAIITNAHAPPNGLGRQHGPARLPASSGCPRHIPTGCLKAAHTATLALLGT